MSDCTCYPVDPTLHTTHYGATDPATTQMPNYDCSEHFPEHSSDLMIPAEVVQAAAKAYRAKVEWIDRHSRDDYGREDDLGIIAALEAAAPLMFAEAWDKGHESGFWNGRESHGDVTGCLIGIEHAKAHNPYRPTQ